VKAIFEREMSLKISPDLMSDGSEDDACGTLFQNGVV